MYGNPRPTGSFNNGQNGQYGVRDFIGAADQQLRDYDAERARFDTLAKDTAARETELHNRQAETFRALSAALLPNIEDTTAIAALAQTLGLPEIVRDQANLFRYREANARRLSEIEASDVYANRDLLRLRVGEKRREVEPLFQYAQAEWNKIAAVPFLAQLVENGYGTDAYARHGFFRFFDPQYQNDWKHADAAAAALHVKTFLEARRMYLDRQEQLTSLQGNMAEILREEARIAAAENERASLLDVQKDLPSETYREIGVRIAAILENGESPLVDRLPNPDALKSRLRQIAGLAAQQQYLDDLRKKIAEGVADIQTRMQKLQAEQQRYSQNFNKYQNKTWGQADWDKRFGPERTARYNTMYDRYYRTSNTVYVFNDYDRAMYYDNLNTILWWDVMTDGRMYGDFLPSVQYYREEYPNYQYQSYDGGGVGGNTYNDPSGVGDRS